MCMKLVVLVTLLTMLAHSILGCCWHHAHGDHGTPCDTASVEVDIHSHQCAHHHGPNGSSTEVPVSHGPAPCKHHAPCDEVDCVFLFVKSLRITFASEFTERFVIPEANWPVTIRNSAPSMRDLVASRETTTSLRHCALIQVWIV